jgi:glycerol-1-phosphate dehydrogenase [NAD(P)+]
MPNGSPHKIELPRLIMAGGGIIEGIGKELSALGVERVGVLTSKTPFRLLGGKLERSLETSGIEYRFFLDDGKPHESVRDEFLETIGTGIDGLVGVGGGRVLDISKLIAEKLGTEFFSVPTIPSHDGIASPLVSILSGDIRSSRFAKTPQAVFADISVLVTAPHQYIASGFGDVIGKYTAVKDWRLAHLLLGEYYGEYTADLALECAEIMMKRAEEVGEGSAEGVRALVEALINCGILISIAGTSRPCSGSEHLFSHALDQIRHTSSFHGQQVGIGTIMMSYLHDADWEKVRNSLAEAKAPTSAKELGVSDEVIVEALVRAASIRPDRYTILGEKGLSEKAAVDLARATRVI